MPLARTAHIDAAVIDVNLHGARSDAVVEVLKRRSIPFIVATGYDEQSAIPGERVLSKPFSPEDLVHSLESVLTR